MTNKLMHNIKDSSIWKRGLYMLLCSFFYSIAEVVLFAVVIFQFVLTLFTGETNQRLLKLGQSLSTYIYQIIHFLSFNSEHIPYPFSGWPRAEPRDLRQNQVREQAANTVEKPIGDGVDSASASASGQSNNDLPDEANKKNEE